MKRIGLSAAAAACLLALTTMPARGQEPGEGAGEASGLPSLSTLETQIRKLVEHHYPRAGVRASGNEIEFEYKVRTFTLDRPGDKGGKTVVRRKVRGPEKHGILCDIELREGQYGGQAAVPQTFDYGPFKLWLAAPESKKHHCHLYIHLWYPPDVPRTFLKDFKKLVNDVDNSFD
jgi:hypothetical protein